MGAAKVLSRWTGKNRECIKQTRSEHIMNMGGMVFFSAERRYNGYLLLPLLHFGFELFDFSLVLSDFFLEFFVFHLKLFGLYPLGGSAVRRIKIADARYPHKQGQVKIKQHNNRG